MIIWKVRVGGMAQALDKFKTKNQNLNGLFLSNSHTNSRNQECSSNKNSSVPRTLLVQTSLLQL
jgi:hypothetical protein